VVEVEVGEHDVAHVARVVAQARDLAHRGVLLAERRPQQQQKKPAQAAGRVGDVAQAEPGVKLRPSISAPPRGQVETQFRWWILVAALPQGRCRARLLHGKPVISMGVP
jgi:hypothetical protein